LYRFTFLRRLHVMALRICVAAHGDAESPPA